MAHSPLVNPYETPASVEILTARPSRSRAATRKFFLLGFLFALLRGASSGFATLIVLGYLSGRVINWRNVVPMLTGILLGCLALHWFEQKFRFPSSTLFIGIFGYIAGVGVMMIAGKLNYFPNPF